MNDSLRIGFKDGKRDELLKKGGTSI